MTQSSEVGLALGRYSTLAGLKRSHLHSDQTKLAKKLVKKLAILKPKQPVTRWRA